MLKFKSGLLSQVALFTAVVLIVTLVLLSAGVGGGVEPRSGVTDTSFLIGHDTVQAGVTVDYQCDGTNDNVQFQQALDALPSSGGEIKFLSGTYDFGATVSRGINGITITGVGKGALINYDGSTAIFDAGSQRGWIFQNFATDAGGVDISSASDTSILGIWVGGTFISDLSPPEKVVRSATFVVAASDSSASSLAQADYICDGTDDDVQIQAAIDALPATGGKVQLSEGTFSIGAKVVVDSSSVWIAGMGASAIAGTGTVLALANNVNDHVIEVSDGTNVIEGFRISDMLIDGNKASQSAGNGILAEVYRSTFENLWIIDARVNSIEIRGRSGGSPEYSVTNMFYRVFCGSPGGDGFVASGDYVGDSDFLECESAIGNAAFNLTGPGYRITDCWAEMPGGYNGNYSVYLNGRTTEGLWSVHIQGCQLGYTQKDVIVVDSNYDVHDIHINDNKIASASASGDDLYSLVRLDLASGKVLKNSFITNNRFEQEIAQRPKYVIEVVSGEVGSLKNCIVKNNVIAQRGNSIFEPMNVWTHNSSFIGDNIGWAHPSELEWPVSQLLGTLGDVRGLWVADAVNGTTVNDWSRRGHDITISQDLESLSMAQRYMPYYSLSATQDLSVGDHADFSSGNATVDEELTLMVVASFDAVAGPFLLTKGNDEYSFYLDGSGHPYIRVYDNSTSAYIGRYDDTPVTTGEFHTIIATYNGTGVISGCKIYLDGVRIDSIDSGSGSYTAMEPLSGDLEAFSFDGGSRLSGDVALWAVAFKELDADEVWSVTRLIEGLLGLQ